MEGPPPILDPDVVPDPIPRTAPPRPIWDPGVVPEPIPALPPSPCAEQGVLRTVCVGLGSVPIPGAVPPPRLEFNPMYEAPHLTAAKAARQHARDVHPDVSVRGG